jgi:hypothetical protein
MLSYAGSPNQRTSLISLSERRSITVQPYLNFLDIPVPETCVWEGLNNDQQRVVLEAIARLIAKTAQPKQEENHD